MKKNIIFKMLVLLLMLSGCNQTTEDFEYEVKFFNVYTNLYENVIHHEFINLQGLNIIKTYEAYVEITYETNFVEHELTYNEDFFKTHTLLLITVYDEKADKFEVDVTKDDHNYDIHIKQINGFNRFIPAVYENIWTIAVEIPSKEINDVQYEIVIDNSYYQFYSYWLRGIAPELEGTHVFETYAPWELYINKILEYNESNINSYEAYFKRHNIRSLLDIVKEETFTDKVIVVYFSPSYEYPESYYLPTDVYKIYPQYSGPNKLYFNMFSQWGSPGIGMESTGHSISLFILDKQSESFTPIFNLNDNYYVR